MFDNPESTGRRADIRAFAKHSYYQRSSINWLLKTHGIDPISEFMDDWIREDNRAKLGGWLPFSHKRPNRPAKRHLRDFLSFPVRFGVATFSGTLALLLGTTRLFVPRRSFRYALVPAMIAGGAVAMHLAAPITAEQVVQTTIRVLTPGGQAFSDKIFTLLDCATRIPIRDSSGLPVGWIPKPSSCDSSSQPDFRTATLTPGQATRFARAIQFVEGSHSVDRTTVGGVNVLGLIRAVSSVPNALLFDKPVLGGSNGIQSGLKNVLNNPGASTWTAKIGYIGQNLVFGTHGVPDNQSRDLFVTMALPVVQGATGSNFGAPIAGGLLPSVVFGKASFADLSDAELCILAAAVKRHIIITSIYTPDAAVHAATKRNDSIRARAISRCVNPMESSGQINELEAEEMRQEIASVVFPSSGNVNIIDPDTMLGRTIPGARALLRDFMIQVAPDSYPTGLDLTLTSAAQRELQTWIPSFERSIAPKLSDALCILDCARNDLRPNILAVTVQLGDDDKDRIVAVWQTAPRLFTGPLIPGSNGTFISGNPTRSLGSVPKIIAVPLFVEFDVDAVCLRRWAGLHDFNGNQGYDCSESSHFLSLEEMLAQSSNLAYAEAISITGIDRLRRYFEAQGFVITNRQSPGILRYSVVTGENAVISPHTLTRNLAALARGMMGREPIASHPRLFVEHLVSGDRDTINLSTLGLRPSVFSESAPYLEAPLTSQNGTLRSLLPAIQALGCSVENLIGKTGSSDAYGQGVRDKLVVLHTVCAGQSYVTVAMVGSPRVDVEIGSVSSRDVGLLALKTLGAALKHAPQFQDI